MSSKKQGQDQSVSLVKEDLLITLTNQLLYWQNHAQKLQAIIDAMMNVIPYYVFWKDLEGKYLGGNQLFVNSLGFSQLGDIIGRNNQELAIPNNFNSIYQAHDQLIIKKKQALLGIIEPLLDESGKIFLINTSKIPLLDQTGNVYGIMGIYEDITQRKKTEEELYIKSLLLDQINSHVTIADLHGNVTYVNQSKLCSNGNCYNGICGPIITNQPEYLTQYATEQEIIAQTLEGGAWRGEVTTYDLAGEKQIMDCYTQIIYDDQQQPIAIGSIAANITEQKRNEQKLKESEEKYRQIFENVQVVIYQIDMEGNFCEISPSIYHFAGYTREELLGRPATTIYFNPNDRANTLQQIFANQGKIENYEIQLKSKTGELIYANTFAQIIYNLHGEPKLIEGVIQKITERKKVEQALLDSEEQFRLLFTQMQLGVALYQVICDHQGRVIDYIFINVNHSFEQLTQLKKDQVLGKRALEIYSKLDQKWLDLYGEVALNGNSKQLEYFDVDLGKHLNLTIYCPKLGQFAVIMDDITEKKAKQEAIEYLSYHDQLTNLKNRRYYEESLIKLDQPKHLPLTLIMGDLNGLKLVNDSLGHSAGDELLIKAANAIISSCRSNDIVARIGGDEFVIILPHTDEHQAEKIIKQIKKNTAQAKVGAIDVSISFGYATKKNPQTLLAQILKKAEDSMYHNKLFESPSMRGRTVHTILKTLHEKNPREEKHSHRVSMLCEKMGIALGWSEFKIKELRTIGLLHDIGKIAIEESILSKTASLTKEEWLEIKRHPEIGYRILNTVAEMSDMAEYILAHHERYDGKGYPKGLKGDEIPLEARIISIADTYDAMTSNRVYREALPINQVIEELKKNAGLQFDPKLIQIFIEKVAKLTPD